MSGEPTFRIDGAELFIGTDHNDDDAVYFLTNKRSLLKGAKKREVLNYSRLISPSVIVKIPLEDLK